MTENSTKQSLVLDFSGFLNVNRITALITAKKQKYKLPGTVSNYLKKIEYERIFDFAHFNKIFQHFLKSKDCNYDLILLENFVEMFLLQEDQKKLKGVVNTMLKKLSKYSFKFNVLIIGDLISHFPARILH